MMKMGKSFVFGVAYSESQSHIPLTHPPTNSAAMGPQGQTDQRGCMDLVDTVQASQTSPNTASIEVLYL